MDEVHGRNFRKGRIIVTPPLIQPHNWIEDGDPVAPLVYISLPAFGKKDIRLLLVLLVVAILTSISPVGGRNSASRQPRSGSLCVRRGI